MAKRNMQLNPDKKKKYLLAVSGGVDSMVMASLFLGSACTFGVAHCNFGLRGAESDDDEHLVEDWCRRHDIPFFTTRFNTHAAAKEYKASIQETARLLRYRFFEEIRSKHGYDLLATAHQRDDNAETMLFHFLRGTGIKGLCGIPAQQGPLLRPMLDFSREEIQAYANQHAIPFRNDSSNAEEHYTRNKIRLGILPMLAEIFPNVNQVLHDNSLRINEAYQLYRESVEAYRTKLIEQRGRDWYIPLRKLRQVKPLHTLIYELTAPFGFGHEESRQLSVLMDRPTGTLMRSASHTIYKNREFFIIRSNEASAGDIILIDEGCDRVECSDFILTFESATPPGRIPSGNQFEEIIDAGQLCYPLILRKWREGDYLYPLGMSKKKKVSRVLIDARIALPDKDRIWVLESDKKIVWIPGVKLDNRFKLNENTQQCLKMKYRLRKPS